jgi:phosphoserine phosphatase
MSEMRLPPEHTAFVGDSDSDIALAKRVELAVAYNSDSEKLKAVCAHVLRHGQLINLAEILGLTAGGGEPAHVSNRPTKDRS